MIYSNKVYCGILVSIAMTKGALVPVSKESPLPVPIVTLFAGARDGEGITNGPGIDARFVDPWSVAISPDLKFALVADSAAHQIRKIIRSTAEVTLIAGDKNGNFGSDDGFGTNASFNQPRSVDISPDGTYALIADYNFDRIRKLVIGTGEVTTFAGSLVDDYGYLDAVGTNAQFDYPTSIAISPDGKYALVTEESYNKVRKIDISTRTVTTLAGGDYIGDGSDYPRSDNGVGVNAYFAHPNGIAISPNGKYALVTEYGNSLIRKIDISTRTVTTIAGSVGVSDFADGYGTSVKFDGLNELDIYPDGSYALIADSNNCAIRKLDLETGEVTTFAGHCGVADDSGTNAGFVYPTGVAISPSGRSALVGDESGDNVRKIQILPKPKPAPGRLR